MSRDLLFGRFLPPHGLLQSGSDAKTRILRVPVRSLNVPTVGGGLERRPKRRHGEARRTSLLQERR